MKLGIFAITLGGCELSLRLKKELGVEVSQVDLYLPKKFARAEETAKPFNSLRAVVEENFFRYDGLVFIMATGIVVRLIGTCLENKRKDPAVVVLDEAGCNVISLLSGHIGGANRLTEMIAEKISARSIVTTATDIRSKPAFDLIAKELNCVLRPFKNLKYANSALVDERRINIYTDFEPEMLKASIKEKTGFNFQEEAINFVDISNERGKGVEELISQREEESFVVIFSNRNLEVDENCLQLVPRNLVVGLGSKKGVKNSEVRAAVNAALKKLGMLEESVRRYATIDLKEEEIGIIDFVEETGRPLDIIERSTIRKSEIEFNESEFVRKKIGVGGACEPAAILAGKNGDLILEKTALNGVTVAVAKENFIL